MVQHEIDEDAAHGNVKLKRQRPTSDLAMLLDAPGPTTIDRKQGERNDRRRQHDVRHEHDEVHAADPSLMPKGNGADLGVMDQVGDEEERRQSESRQHTGPVSLDLPPANEHVAG